MTADTDVRPGRTTVPRVSPRQLLSLLPSALASVLAPAVAYSQIRPHVPGTAMALLAATAIPVTYTLVIFAWRRRVDPLGLLSVAGFAIAVAVSFLTGGSALAVELQDPAETGALGLVCIASVIARRPLWLLVLRLAARRNARAASRLADPASRRTAAVETAIIGAILLVHATVITILALTVPPGTFLALSRPVGLPLIAAGITALVWYRRRGR